MPNPNHDVVPILEATRRLSGEGSVVGWRPASDLYLDRDESGSAFLEGFLGRRRVRVVQGRARNMLD